MDVPRLGVQLELQLPVYATAIAMPDLSHVCDLHHSSRQCPILNPVRPGTEPAISWFLVGFLSAEPQWEGDMFLMVLSGRTDAISSAVKVWEGLNVVKTGRVMLGETNPADSKPGTIRGDFCIQVGR